MFTQNQISKSNNRAAAPLWSHLIEAGDRDSLRAVALEAPRAFESMTVALEKLASLELDREINKWSETIFWEVADGRWCVIGWGQVFLAPGQNEAERTINNLISESGKLVSSTTHYRRGVELQLHRDLESGPAVIYSSGQREFWTDGVHVRSVYEVHPPPF